MAEAFPWNTAPTYLVRDNDRAYGQAFQRRIRAMGIRDRPTSARSPWQNPYAERLVGTLRRECLDHVLIVSERHLRRMLASYSFVLLQRVADALGVGEGCTVTASHPEMRSDHHHANSFQTAPSLCADMIFGKDSPAQRNRSFSADAAPIAQAGFALVEDERSVPTKLESRDNDKFHDSVEKNLRKSVCCPQPDPGRRSLSRSRCEQLAHPI
jgi:hypothetical protein